MLFEIGMDATFFKFGVNDAIDPFADTVDILISVFSNSYYGIPKG